MTEIEITPEMIEAGKRVVAGGYLSLLEPEELAIAIYAAMRPLEPAPNVALDARTGH